MNAYLMHGPLNGTFMQVNSLWPPPKLYFPVQEDLTANVMPDDPTPMPPPLQAEYVLDSVLPLPRPLRGKIATYRYRTTQPKEVKK